MRISESGALVEWVVAQLIELIVISNLHLRLRPRKIQVGRDDAQRKDLLVDSALGAADVVEDKVGVLQPVHQLKLHVDCLDPMAEGRFVDFLRNFPNCCLLCNNPLLPVATAT